MSHVDEGTLHAYLDGALEEYPATEARRVRDHLETCLACRERLAGERRIRDEAASLLGLTVPRVEFPALEELRAYAQPGATRRAADRRRLHWLGWAASLVLALGAGWTLRGGQRGRASQPMDVRVGQEAASPAGGPAGVTAPVEIAQADAPLREELPSARPAVPEIVPIAIDTPPAAVAEDDPLVGPLDALDLAPPALPEPRAIVVAASGTPPADPPVASGDPSTERRSAPGDVVTSAAASAPTPGLALGRGSSDARDATAATDDSYSLVVPGLPVLDVRFRGSGTRPEGQVALQRLESGDTLQVIHLPLDLDPAALEERPQGINELAMKRSTGWIVMRAPRDDAQLMELMTRLLSGR